MERPDLEQMVVVSRLIDAPRVLVWNAWSDPRHLVRWWGGSTYSVPVCEVDFRVGGAIRFLLRRQGRDYCWCAGEYREIVAPQRLVFTHRIVDERGRAAPHPALPDFPAETLVTVRFSEQAGKTLLMLTQEAATGTAAEARAFAMGRPDVERLWREEFERLAGLLTGS
jgi:uncharacterized protein YndB with AHSA1/START domain